MRGGREDEMTVTRAEVVAGVDCFEAAVSELSTLITKLASQRKTVGRDVLGELGAGLDQLREGLELMERVAEREEPELVHRVKVIAARAAAEEQRLAALQGR